MGLLCDCEIIADGSFAALVKIKMELRCASTKFYLLYTSLNLECLHTEELMNFLSRSFNLSKLYIICNLHIYEFITLKIT